MIEKGSCALIPYLTGGFPTLERSREIFQQMVDGGADVIEVGMPYSDPVADGPTIQRAAQQALDAGTTLPRLLETFSTIDSAVPRVLMTYANPILRRGIERALDELRDSGFRGLIIPDIPLEESLPFQEAARARGIDWIPLIAPTSPLERARRIIDSASGFAYHVSVAGTTGVRGELPQPLTERLDQLRRESTRPIAVGFGIGSTEQIESLRPHCDGIVIGSRLVDAVFKNEPIEPLIRSFKAATQETTPC